MPSHYHLDVSVPVGSTPSEQNLPLNSIAECWLAQLEVVFSDGCSSGLSAILHPDSWWRDMLIFDWDFHSVRGLLKIQEYILRHRSRVKIANIRLMTEGSTAPVLESPQRETTWIRAIFTFDCHCGSGSGIVYLTHNESQEMWKAFAVYTALQDIRGLEFRTGPNRPEGTTCSMSKGTGQGTCNGYRQRVNGFQEEEPRVMVVGGGRYSRLTCDGHWLTFQI